jgi:phosphosulfolactate synthase
MSEDPGLKNKAFSFIRVAPRPGKPRETGLTIVADRGMAMNRVTDLIESGGDYIDLVKIGIGAFRLQSEDMLKRKIEALHRAASQAHHHAYRAQGR